MIRIGLGYDIHKLIKKRKFLLAGVDLPFKKGEDGHSDGDVLAHAVSDALLGASALGDIGEFFPPSDPAFKNADSMELMRDIYKRVQQSGWKVINLDCVIICEEPKILPYREVIRKSLAETLELPLERVFVKGKTAEGTGAAGKGRAVEAHVVCLLEKAE